MSAPSPKHIAIVGAGPSGCFTAQGLQRAWPDAQITLFDRFAAPYGLVRYGVAADHQHTKAITRQFDRLFLGPNIRFAGNIEVGTDITLEQLRAAFDIVVLASGRWRDRPLTVPGAKLSGVIPSGDIVNALNAIPRPSIPMPKIGEDVVVVGAGNVAFDMVRFLGKTAADYAGSDVSSAALNSYLAHPAKRVTVLSRSPIASAKMDVAMVRELGKIAGVHYSYANSVPATEDNKLGKKREEAFAELAALAVPEPRVEVRFVFGAEPSRIRGSEHVEGVELAVAPEGEASFIPANTVISAIGFEVHAPGQWHYAPQLDFAPNETTGRIETGLYRVGWLKRGPHGAIPANRADSNEVAKEIITDVETGELPIQNHTCGYQALPDSVRQQAVSFPDWQRIDRAEIAAADTERVRKKFIHHADMLEAARNQV